MHQWAFNIFLNARSAFLLLEVLIMVIKLRRVLNGISLRSAAQAHNQRPLEETSRRRECNAMGLLRKN